MKKVAKKNIASDLKEFIDDDGKKWVQTSTDDLFSLKELNEILESIEKDKETGEVVLARIDFQKVNKEYYDAVITLQTKLRKQSDFLKKVVSESKEIIDRKNKKLKELIEYIKKMHLFLSYINMNPEKIGDMQIPADVIPQQVREEEVESLYEEVEEVVLQTDEESS